MRGLTPGAGVGTETRGRLRAFASLERRRCPAVRLCMDTRGAGVRALILGTASPVSVVRMASLGRSHRLGHALAYAQLLIGPT